MNKIAEAKYSQEEIKQCVDLLEDLVKNSVELAHLSKEQRIAILKAAGEISRPDRDEIRKRKKDRIRLKKQRIDDHERKIRKATGIVRRVKPRYLEHPKPFYTRIRTVHF